MKQFFDSVEFNWKDAIWWGIAIGFFIGRRFTGPVGSDWQTYFQAVSKGFQNMPNVANPPYTAILLYPVTLLPLNWGSELFTLINMLGVTLACKLVGGNRWAFLLSFPFAWLVWYGQIDGLVALGIGLGYWAARQKKPYWVGIACVLMGIKPQIGGILALYYLWHVKSIKAFLIPSIVIAVSVIVYGFWPIDYLGRFISPSGSTFFTEQLSNIGLFPWGCASWLIFLFGPFQLRQRAILILGATMLSSPYTAHYSTISLIVFPLPWWSYIFFSAPFVLPARLDAIAVMLGVILVVTFPLTLRFWRKLASSISSRADLAKEAADGPG